MSETKLTLEEAIRQIVREEAGKIAKDETHAILGALGIGPQRATEDPDDLVDAEQIAPILGYKVSTEALKKKAIQRVYYLARQKEIPSTRVSPRQLRFSPTLVRRALEKKSAGA